MLTKNERNSIKALRIRDNRHRENRMVVEGLKGVLELLNSSLITERIYITSGTECSTIKSVAKENLVEVCEVSKKDMEIMSSLKTAPGVLAVGEIGYASSEEIKSSLTNPKPSTIPTLLLLDDLVDPGNVGTLIRTALWFGFAGVICSPRTVDVWNSKTIQSSMGAVFKIPIIVADICDFINTNEINCAALDAGGENIYKTESIPNGILIGSESHGVSEEIKAVSNEIWSIPGSGKTESLNASIAGAIACAEVAKRWSTLSS